MGENLEGPKLYRLMDFGAVGISNLGLAPHLQGKVCSYWHIVL